MQVRQPGFENGGGALAEYPGGILVASRNGKFFSLADGAENETPLVLPTQIDINQDAYEVFAAAEGYTIRPGTNVGYAGLGMRLHDVLLSTDKRQIFVSYSYWDKQKNCATMRVSKADFSVSNLVPQIGSWQQIFESKPCLGLSGYKAKPFAGHQSGGRMIEKSPGKILLTIGDYKNDGVKREVSVVDADVDYGKIHEIDVASASARVFTTGHRNPQGFVKTSDGHIWATEHGPVGGDEINLIVEGQNYGWPHVTLGFDCRGCDWQIEGRHNGYVSPIFSFLPSIGISNLIEVKGFVENWEGDLLVASMVEQSLHHLRMDGTRVVYDEKIELNDRLRDMIQREDGRIVIWTDSGKLVVLSVDEAKSVVETMAQALSPAAQEVFQSCKSCHAFEAGKPPQGKISLSGIAGRAKASTEYPSYSDAMKSKGGNWDSAALDQYLANPQAAVPGTTMPFEGIADVAIRKELVDFLTKLQ